MMREKEKKKKVGSVGKKVGIIISILLLVILGSRSVYDSVSSYKQAVENNENFEREETRTMARMIEGRFAKAYESGAALIAAIKADMNINAARERRRETVQEIVTQIYFTNPNLSAVGVFLSQTVLMAEIQNM